MKEELNLSDWNICEQCFEKIIEIVPEGGTILELGSGWGSELLNRFFETWSVENDPEWIGKYKTNYIYAPLVRGWYDRNALVKEMPKEYDLILVDGPRAIPSNIRYGFYYFLHLFNTDASIIIDDVHRRYEMRLLQDVSKKIGRPYEIHTSDGKEFAIIKALSYER